jgi:hypothetical protein
MGFSYLDGKSWIEVSRDERLFCSELYHELKDNEKKKKFIYWLYNQCSLELNFPELDVEWEIGFEVVFYRDFIKYHGMAVINEKFPLKRTFDLCLFSENRIIIFEAKAHQGFNKKQQDSFKKDIDLVSKIVKRRHRDISVNLIGICSSQYLQNPRVDFSVLNVFNGIVTWEELYHLLDNDVFLNADSIYNK